jgi:hypothetical protein
VDVPAGGVLDDPVPAGGVVEVPAGGALELEALSRFSKFRSCTFKASIRCCLSEAVLACAAEI